MTDMDFDELDRAVSSLMTKHQASRPANDPTPKPSDDETVLKLDDSVPVTDQAIGLNQSQSKEIESQPQTSAVEATPTEESPVKQPHELHLLEAVTENDDQVDKSDSEQSPEAAVGQRFNLPSRRSGRFMDVVHPSSDMRNESSTSARVAAPAPKPAVSRTGLTLAPAVPQVDEPLESSDRPVVDSIVSPDTETEAMVDNSTVDTIDTLSFDHEDTIQSDLNHDSSTLNESLSSPFLSDAKVDKRPLGGSNPVNAEVSVESEAPEQAPDEGYTAESQEDDTQTAPSRVVQAELRSDLISLESDNTSASDKPGSQSELDSTSDDNPVVQSKPQPSALPVQPAGPIAITQQYKQEPSSSPTESGSIYDTADYHQPLAHPPKKSSGWMWVVWVIVLLVLGAGSGAAAYFLLIQ